MNEYLPFILAGAMSSVSVLLRTIAILDGQLDSKGGAGYKRFIGILLQLSAVGLLFFLFFHSGGDHVFFKLLTVTFSYFLTFPLILLAIRFPMR